MSHSYTEQFETSSTRVFIYLALVLLLFITTTVTVIRYDEGRAGGWIVLTEFIAFIASARAFFITLRHYLRERMPLLGVLEVLDRCADNWPKIAVGAGGIIMFINLSHLFTGNAHGFVAGARTIALITGLFVLVPFLLDVLTRPRYIAKFDDSRGTGGGAGHAQGYQRTVEKMRQRVVNVPTNGKKRPQ